MARIATATDQRIYDLIDAETREVLVANIMGLKHIETVRGFEHFKHPERKTRIMRQRGNGRQCEVNLTDQLEKEYPELAQHAKETTGLPELASALIQLHSKDGL